MDITFRKMSIIIQLKKLIVRFLLKNKIPLTLEFYIIDFSKIKNIFIFLKTVYLVFLKNLDMMRFYEFTQFVLYEVYGYKFVEYKFIKPQNPRIPDYLKFESEQFEIYLNVREKMEGKLIINTEFSLKLNTDHQGQERRYVVSKLITSGSYGKVYLCADEYGNQFAMKFFQSKDEMDIELKALNHLEEIDQVIKPLDHFEFSVLGIEIGAFVMPFMKYTFKSFVETKKPAEDFLLRVFYQFLLNLINIHKLGCFHMDIKPENILMQISCGGIVDMKIADFGLAEILPEGTHYATTSDGKVTAWFRCPVNSLAEANGTNFQISWIADFFALCASMIYMCSHKSGRTFDFVDSSIFNIFRGQQYFKKNYSDDKSPKEIDVEFSKVRIETACQAAIKNPFFCDVLMEYMNPESIVRWYSELQTSPKNNSVIPEVIAKIETYYRMRFIVSQLKENFKKSESDVETPPRPRQCAHVSSP